MGDLLGGLSFANLWGRSMAFARELEVTILRVLLFLFFGLFSLTGQTSYECKAIFNRTVSADLVQAQKMFDFVRSSNIESLKVVIETGINPNVQINRGPTLLAAAAELVVKSGPSAHDQREKALQVVKLLIQNGAKTHFLSEKVRLYSLDSFWRTVQKLTEVLNAGGPFDPHMIKVWSELLTVFISSREGVVVFNKKGVHFLDVLRAVQAPEALVSAVSSQLKTREANGEVPLSWKEISELKTRDFLTVPSRLYSLSIFELNDRTVGFRGDMVSNVAGFRGDTVMSPRSFREDTVINPAGFRGDTVINPSSFRGDTVIRGNGP